MRSKWIPIYIPDVFYIVSDPFYYYYCQYFKHFTHRLVHWLLIEPHKATFNWISNINIKLIIDTESKPKVFSRESLYNAQLDKNRIDLIRN